MVGTIARLAGAPYVAQLFVILGFISCAGQSTDGDDEAHGGGASNLGGGVSGGTRTSGGSDSGGSARGGVAGGDGGAPGGTAGSSTGGTGDGGAGDGGAGAGGEGGLTAGVCRDPRAWSADLVACEGNFVHRPAPVACPLPARDETIPDLPPNAGVEDFVRDEMTGDCDPPEMACRLLRNDCTRDADCGVGYCLRTVTGSFEENPDVVHFYDIRHLCHTPCTADSDCASNELCTCKNVTQNATRRAVTLGACVPAACRADTDCGQSTFCIAPLTYSTASGPPRELGSFHCQSPGDGCHGPDVCPFDNPYTCGMVPLCSHDGDHFVCGQADPEDLCSF